jgi:hypothetical protein
MEESAHVSGRARSKGLKYVAPFPTFWYIGLPSAEWGAVMAVLRAAAQQSTDTSPASFGCTLANGRALWVAERWQDLPPHARPLGSKDSSEAELGRRWNTWCREGGLGKLCRAYALTAACLRPGRCPFAHLELAPKDRRRFREALPADLAALLDG